MFNFLNRNKSVDHTINKTENTVLNSNSTLDTQLQINEAKKNLYDSITLNRTDIVVSFLNEWFKEKTNEEYNIKYFFNSNYCENGTTNPLLVAYNLKSRDIVRALLNFGADPGLIDNKNKKCLTQLIKEDTNNSMKQVLSDCFMQLIVQNNLISLKQFLSSGFEINLNEDDFKNITLPDNNTYLHWAALYSTEPIARLLLENGADPNRLNDKGATPLHEIVAKQNTNEETLRIIETLLVFKADTTNLRGKSGVFKDQTVMDLAFSRFHNQPEIYNLIKDFLSDASLSSTTSSTPNSPLTKSNSVPNTITANIANALDSLSLSASSQTPSKPAKTESENFLSWNKLDSSESKGEDLAQMTSLLWPQPQLCNILSENFEDRFLVNDVKTEPFYIYIKPPHTYSYMDLINKLASSFSGKYLI